MNRKTNKVIFTILVIGLIGALLPGHSVNATLENGDNPDSDPYYDRMVLIGGDGTVFFGDSGGEAIDPNATVSYNTDGSIATVDYNATKLSKSIDGNPRPNAVFVTTATITNNTTQDWELDVAKSMEIFLWQYLQESTSSGTLITYNNYVKALNQWIMFKLEIVKPDGTSVVVSPYATITDYSGTAGYHFPAEADSHVASDLRTSLEGDYYAKAMLPVPNITLRPGESMQVPWAFGMSWYADGSVVGSDYDFHFRLVFNKVAEPTYPYVVNYYRDAVNPDNLLGSQNGVTSFIENYELKSTDVIADLGANWMNAYQPTGYEEGQVGTYPMISIDASTNIINVVYTKMEEPPIDDNETPNTGIQGIVYEYYMLLMFGSLLTITILWRKKITQ